MATPTESERIPTDEEFEICATIDRWRREMARQIETIDRCRRGNLSYGQILELVELPVQLATDSKTLIRVLAHYEPDLDSRLFERLSKAIETWCSSYDVSKLPPQNDLWRLFEAAEAICTTLESDIIHRAIKGEPPWEQMAAAEPQGAIEVEKQGQAATVMSDEAKEAPALTEIERTILQVLGEYDPGILLTAQQISDATKDPEVEIARYVGLSSTKNSIRKLIMRGLAERPEGDKAGARLTTKGRLALAKLRPSLTKINPK